jgi:hypothetical protein
LKADPVPAGTKDYQNLKKKTSLTNGAGTGTDVRGSSGGVFSHRKMNPPSIPAQYEKKFKTHHEVPYADSQHTGA